jgi:hypothetical protein
MKREDFDKKIIEQIEQYSDIIVAMLGMTWNISLELAENNAELKKKVESQLIFFLEKCRKIDSVVKVHDVEQYYKSE